LWTTGFRGIALSTRRHQEHTFGDCFAYALAKDRDEPLLFKGNDFTHTDVTPALPAA